MRGRMAANDHEEGVILTPVLRLKDVECAPRFARQLELGSPIDERAGR